MNDERWGDILDKVQEQFTVIEHETESLEDRPGQVEFIVFDGPVGKMKLERTTTPKVLGTKGLGSNRIGSDTAIQYEYSDSEEVHTFTAYVWKDEQWTEMEADNFDL